MKCVVIGIKRNTKQTKNNETNEKILDFRLFRYFSFVSCFSSFQNQNSDPTIGLKLIPGGIHTFAGCSRTVDQDLPFAHAGE